MSAKKLAFFAVGLAAAGQLARADFVEHSRQPAKAPPSAPPKARPFRFDQVRLLPGVFLDSQEAALRYLKSLEPDRLLAGFRKEAGLAPKAEPYGGWERTQLAGHSLGHYLSAISLAYAATGDAAFRRRAEYIVKELAACQKAFGDGYVAAIPKGRSLLGKLAEGKIDSAPFRLNGLWSPLYVLHKEMAGLRDAWRLCGVASALDVEKGLADWIDRTLAPLSPEQMERALACEYGGMNEVLADLYADTGDPRYLALAQRFQDRAVVGAMIDEVDILPGKHANTQIPKMVGLATLYELTGNPRARRGAEFFWKRVVRHHSYASGGNGNREHFGPPDCLSDRLGPDTAETCNVYNMLKLTAHTLSWSPNAEAADYYERALLNHILATHREDGRVIYNLSLQPGGRKAWQTLYDSFTCCVGTGMENHVRYSEAVYFHDAESLWVNLYLASELRWPEKGLRLRQQTRFPYGQESLFELTLEKPTELTLRFRVPRWAREGFAVEVNGKPAAAKETERGYLAVKRVWRTGDRARVRYPMRLRAERMPDNPRRVAIFYGPVLLAADLGPAEDPKAQDPLYVPVLITRGRPAAQWAKPLDAKKLQFRTSGVGRPRDVELKPFFAFRDRRYTVYFDIVSPAEWRQRLQAAEAEREKARRLAERGIDQVKIGDAESEKAHQLQGEKTGAGRAMGRPWRHAVDGGWFAYRLGVDPEKPVDLMCLYWGSESGERLFDILVEGKRVATQRLRNNRPGKFFEQIYPIPQELTRGKQNVLVRFQARPGAMAGGVFGVWTLRRGAQPEKQEKAAGLSIPEKVSPVSDYRLKPAAIKNVKLLPGFWRNRLETNRVATVWHCFEQCEKTGRIDNFRVAAGIKEGQFRGYYFNDSDVYKVMEGAAYTLMTHPDPKLEAYLDELIAIIARAQRPDGYIYTPRIIGKAASQPPGGMKRWASIASAHELYCMGHLIEAAVAHAQATGKETFLNVARKAADLICSVFNEKGNLHPSGHEEIELALVKLYRQTGDPKYLREAYFFLELRGRSETHRLYGPYSQDHQPVAEQREAVGHAVRAAYLYSGTADAAALLNHRPYFEALRAIWKDVVGSKLYITGGIGATGGNEGFDASYRLPNLTAYCETCAAIANALWNHRMFLLTENGEHMDVFERSLYNNVLSGVALDGRSFFYSNPLESDGRHRRSPWFGCACCPPNIARILPQVPSFAYSAGTDRLWVNLYLASEATIQVGGGSVQVAQRTRYPWSGRVELTLRPEGGAREFALCLRIPGWARNQALPGGLYWFARERRGGVRLRLNGKPARWTLSKGYAVLRRRWRAGDRIELILPMPIRRVLADPRVQDDAGKVAFQRGPIVYCVEWPEVPGGSVKSLMVPDGAQLAAVYEPDLLGGVETLRGQAVRLAKTATPGQLERKPVDFKAIPYYAWANRGRGEMAVWLARTESAARPLPAPPTPAPAPSSRAKSPSSPLQPGRNALPNPSFENGKGDRPEGWGTQRWSGSARFQWARIGHAGKRSVQISSDSGADVGWTATVPVEPFARYRLSGWIKTEKLQPGSGRGALFNIHNLQGVATPAVSGTRDWTRVEVEFDVDDLDALQINCLFGGWGRSVGTAWYDDVRLELISRKPRTAPRVAVQADQVGAPMSPFIYGQFIEHLGRCIYGGIWSEMLQDRKFFFPAGDAKSPWKKIGAESAVSMSEEKPLAGRQDLLLRPSGKGREAGVEQGGLGLKAGMDYVGRIRLAGDPSAAPVRVTLVWGDEPAFRQTIRIRALGPEFRSYPLRFRAGRTTTEGALRIVASGKGSVRVGAVSLMPADNLLGMRADTLDLLRRLNAPVYRWPGGNFVSGYNWKDGLGDPDRRPPRKNPAWQGLEPNDFGVDEFLRFCRILRAEPYLVVNSGLGEAESAAQEVQYVNGPADSPMGRLRARNGHPEPYGARFWAIGNEMYGRWQLGHMPVEEYVKKHNRFAEAMRAEDPRIKLVGVGAVGSWDEAMLRGCADHMDLISEHFYCGERAGLYGHMRQIPDNIRRIVQAHRRYRREIPQLQGKDIRIVMDEWNYWYGPHVFGELGTRYFLKDALGIAAGLHEYARQSDMVFMANYAQTVNVIGCIKTSKLHAAFETTGLALELYRRRFGTLPAKTEVSGLIDAQAAWTADRKRLTLGLVNPSLSSVRVPLEIRGARLGGAGVKWTLTGPDPKAFNDPDRPARVVVNEAPAPKLDKPIELPPCSVMLLSLEARPVQGGE